MSSAVSSTPAEAIERVAEQDCAAWLVDLDGTLYRQRPVRLAMAAELLLFGPHRLRLIRCFREQQEILRSETADSGLSCPYHEQLKRTATVLDLSVAQIAPVISEWMEQRPCKWLRLFRRQSLLDEIAAFRRRGGRTAIVSDYPARTKLAGLGIAELFDVVVACGDPGGPARLKPSPDGYLLAAERLGVEPRECLVLGDRTDADGKAARLAAMQFRLIR